MKRILIDTRVFIWWTLDDFRLSKAHRIRIEDPSIDIMVSCCSLFEVAIKKSIGKLDFELDFNEALIINSVHLLQIAATHLEKYIRLPMIQMDPFDRMIIAQSNAEQIPLITYDQTILKYDVHTI